MKILFKRIISLFIIFSLTSTLAVFAFDYSGHWAEKEIEELIKSGIVKGDSSGIRPDETISRAELVAVINRLFSYKESDGTAFPDVNKSAWYYNDMCVAKTAGYIKGDNYGNANPAAPVTRAEACTMFARILNMEATNIIEPFEDDNVIPGWAKSYVYALSRTGLVMGYVDGTFKPDNSMNRAEVFVISSRILKSSAIKENEDNNSAGAAVIQSNSSSGGGGGGGSTGGSLAGNSNDSGVLPVPIIKNIDNEKMIVTWDLVPGAIKYELVLKRKTNGNEAVENITFESNSTSASISSEVNQLMNNKKPTEAYSIKVRAVSSVPSKSSEFSVEEDFTFENPSVKLPELRVSQTILNDGSETIKIIWDPAANASGYQLSTDLGDGNGYTPLTVNGECVVIDNDTLSKLSETQVFKFKATSAVPNILDSEEKEITLDIPLYGGKEGGYWLIKNQRHFENIAKNKDQKFLVAQNIILDSNYVPIDEFRGELNSKSGYGITLDINDTTNDNAGLFAGIRKATIKNITIFGNVKGKINVGAVAGVDFEGSEITNCKNKAKITSLNNSATDSGGIGGILGNLSSTGKITNCINEETVTTEYNDNDIGGIVGITSANGGVIQSCVNKGAVSGNQRVGGIVGYLKTKGNVRSSRNDGDITVASSNGGGIVGYSYGNITDCYNTGNITGNGVLAGIVAVTADNIDITNCYNTGEIRSENNNFAAGIVANISANNKTVNLSNCYNIGAVTSSKGFPVYSNKVEGAILNVSYCYYIDSLLSSEAKPGVEAKSDAELKTIDLGEGYDFNVQGGNPTYLYPQIKSNPHKTGLRDLPSAPFNLTYSKDELTQAVLFVWENMLDNDYDSLLLTIMLDGEKIDGYNEKEIDKAETSFLFENTEEPGTYTAILVSKNTTGKSEELTLSFEIADGHANFSFKNFLNASGLDSVKDKITPFEYKKEQ